MEVIGLLGFLGSSISNYFQLIPEYLGTGGMIILSVIMIAFRVRGTLIRVRT